MHNEMPRHRYQHLQYSADPKLTEEELKEGWHFCKEWDFMLIHKSWPEFEACICNLESNPPLKYSF